MKRILLFIAISLLSISCSLDEHIEGFADRATAYDTRDQAEAVVNKCYTYLNNFITTNFGLMNEACTDLWYCDTGTVDAYLNISPSNPGHGTSVWNNCYAGVMCCNEAIACIEASEKISQKDKQSLLVEAKALRALYYYYLTNTFDGVPFYTYMVADRETQDKIQKLPRTDADEIRKALYEDLKFSVENYCTAESGLIVRPSENRGNRTGYALSLMLMAKFAMWVAQHGDSDYWNNALYALEKLEDLYGKDLNKYPLEETSWNIKNTPESIFELQHAWSTTGVQYSSSYGRLLLPPYKNGKFDGVSMPELGENLANWAELRATKHFIVPSDKATETSIFSNPPLSKSPIDGLLHIDKQIIEEIESFDHRMEYVIGLGKISTGATFSNVASGKYCYAGPKFWCMDMVSSYDSNNYKLFRYADAVLMMAECYARKFPNDFAKATEYLNKTRERAGLDKLADFTSEDTFMAELYDERARELAGELHRKYDLVRWGVWYEWLAPDGAYKYNTYSKLQQNIRPCHEYYPIPDTECSLSDYILTNDAYKAE